MQCFIKHWLGEIVYASGSCSLGITIICPSKLSETKIREKGLLTIKSNQVLLLLRVASGGFFNSMVNLGKRMRNFKPVSLVYKAPLSLISLTSTF